MKLTPREKEIVALLVRGEKREAIASMLKIHVRTVDFHLVNVRRKFGVVSSIVMALRFSAPAPSAP